MCTTKVSPSLATASPLEAISMPELSMATWPRGSVSTAKISPAGAATARCTSSRSGMRRLSHPGASATAYGARRLCMPVVLGSGKPYFGRVDAQHLPEDPHMVVLGDRVLHLRYRVRREPAMSLAPG